MNKEEQPDGTTSPADSKGTPATEAPPTLGQSFRELLRTWGPAILAVVIIRSFIFEPFSIPSQSMVPTLLIGDHVLVTKFSYGIWLRIPFTTPSPSTEIELIDVGDPARGDIIVFKYPKEAGSNIPIYDPGMKNYIKRVVGIPGDEIEVRKNRLYINGKEQTQTQDATFTFQNRRCVPNELRHFSEDLSGVKHSVLKEDVGRTSIYRNFKPTVVPPDSVFVMGDNRDHSGDSREWGFVPYHLIKGKAHFVWFSWDSCAESYGESLRVDRLFHWLYE